MGRLILLVGVCLVILGSLMTFKVPSTWIGNLPGDFSVQWKGTLIYVPFTTSVVFSFALSILLFIFSKK